MIPPADAHLAQPEHIPVLAQRCLDLMSVALSSPRETESPHIVIDGTLGLGGHSKLILEQFPDVHLIGIDRDPRALAIASERLAGFGSRFTPVHATYDQVLEVATQYGGESGVSAILLDLGVSSMQLDETARGFSYAHDAPLDMRMDQSRGISAQEFLAQADESEIRHTLFRYGDERHAGRIARAVVKQRETQELRTTGELVALIREALPAAVQRTGGHPAKRTFQAIRIAVNDELQILSETIPAALQSLRVGGHCVVMSYHSGEDRIVKREFARAATSTAPPDFPVELPEHMPWVQLLTKGAEKASPSEISQNPRATSVRLRAAKKIRQQQQQGAK